ncbi:MAG TPA: SpoIIE family protein phosphatase [Kofleriaceae bacterium]|nr:SpoIIE family protein phosphatase [Kofleriaceae bacterium]
MPFDGGALVAAIDGLGHGEEAARAAERCAQVLTRMPDEPLIDIVRQCHDELRQTRGVVLSLASFDDRGSMTWLGVGNVEALLVRADSERTEAIPARGGTVGYQLPPLMPRTLAVRHGDTLVLATDGIRHGFKQEVHPSRSPQEIADLILAGWAKGSDDAFAIVARFIGVARDGATVEGSTSWAR